MDILSLDTQTACDTSIDVELMSPLDGNGIGVFFTIVGKDSKICKDYSRDQIDEALKKAHRAKQRGKDLELQTSEKLHNKEIDFLVVCTRGWYSRTSKSDDFKKTITFGTEELEFNKVNVKKVYSRLPWIPIQIDDAIGDISLFMTI